MAIHIPWKNYPVSADLRFEDGNSCAQMRRRSVEKLQHERMAFQGLLDDTALHAYTPAVNEPHLPEPRGVCVVQILFHDGRDVCRGEGMKVEGPFDGNPEGVLILHR